MPHLIGIAGPSGAGKTWLARSVAGVLEAPIISLDSYYLDLVQLPLDERAKTNFDVPESLDDALLTQHVAALVAGEEIEVPVYDFSRHTRSSEVTRVRAKRFAIVEGLFALYWPELRGLLGTRVYVQTVDEICFERRLERDMRERGRTRESVCAQYEHTVRPMAARHIWPTKRFADFVISGVDPVAANAEKLLAHIEAQVPDMGAIVSQARAALAVVGSR